MTADAQTLREIAERDQAFEACIERIERMLAWHVAKRDRADFLGIHETRARYHQRVIAFEDAIEAIRALPASQEQRRG